MSKEDTFKERIQHRSYQNDSNKLGGQMSHLKMIILEKHTSNILISVGVKVT